MFLRNCLYDTIAFVGLAKEIVLLTTSLLGPATLRAQVLSLCFEDSRNPSKICICTPIVNIYISF